MNESPPQDEKGTPEDDSAWVTIETPFDAKGLSGFLDDVERLFRINSLLVFEKWQSLGNGEYQFEAMNLSSEKTVKTGFKAVREGISPDDQGMIARRVERGWDTRENTLAHMADL